MDDDDAGCQSHCQCHCSYPSGQCWQGDRGHTFLSWAHPVTPASAAMFDNRDTVKFIIPLPPLPSTPIPIIALAGWMSDMPPFPEAAIAALTVASASASAYASASSTRMRHIPSFLTAALSGVSRNGGSENHAYGQCNSRNDKPPQ